MKSILIRNLPERTLDNLKKLAAVHHRSLQGELHHILEDAAGKAPLYRADPPKLHTVHSRGGGTWRKEDVYDDDAR